MVTKGDDARRVGLLIAAFVLPVVALGVIAAVVLTREGPPVANESDPVTPPTAAVAAAPTASSSASSVTTTATTATTAPAAEPNALGEVALELGTKGTGPGQIDDARAIAVDANGDVYVADYGTRRIQRFDASGKLAGVIEIQPGPGGSSVPSIATTSDGHLWVSRSGDLLKLALPDGKVVKTVPNRSPVLAYTAMTVDAKDLVYAENVGATTFVSVDGKGPPKSDELRKLDKQGALLAAWKGVRSNVLPLTDHLAVDREGTLYLLERGGRINVIDAHGKLKAELKGSGDGGIAVDDKSRIFVGTSRGVLVLDQAGNKLGEIGAGDVDNLAVGRDGRIYTVSRRKGRVQVLALR